ncbi:ABC transporter ATP-binding protein [Candidatus Auribacterota bacterium]
MQSYRKLIKFLIPHWKILLAASGCMFFVSIFENISVTAAIPFIDKIIADKPIEIPNPEWIPNFVEGFIAKINALSRLDLLIQISIWLVILYFFKGISVYGKSYLMEMLGQRVIQKVRDQLYEKLTRFPLGFYAKKRTGELISRITYDTSVIKSTVSAGFADLISQSIQLLASLVTLFIIKQSFAIPNRLIIYGLFVMLVVVYPVLSFAKRVRKLSKLSQEKMGDLNSILFETVAGISIVKGFLLEKFKIGKFKDKNFLFYKYIMKSNKRIKAISPLTEFVCVVSAAIILWVGGEEVVHGTLDAGGLIAFLGGILLLNKPLKKLSGIHSINQQALSASERIYEILEEPEEIETKQEVKEYLSFKEAIEFKNVSLKYQEKMVLENISFKVEKGGKVAIVGPSGSGKTTILNLIPRFYDPVSGCVEMDSQNLKDMRIKSVRKQVGIVSQENILFNGTIKENIAYGLIGNEEKIFNGGVIKFDDVEEKIVEVSKIAYAHKFVEKLPDKYNTMIGDRGITLSGGERQRIAIARALLKNPPILILDEATSQLDAESEKLVQEALHILMKGRTVFVVAHRFSTIKEIEKIMVLEAGRIVAVGSHNDLIKDSPLYQRLYQTQFSTS